MAHYAGIVETDPVALERESGGLADYVGQYDTIAMAIEVSQADGGLKVAMTAKPAFLESLGATAEDFAEPPVPIGMVGAEGDKFVVTEGAAKGMKGYFARNDAGEVSGVHMGGRLAARL